MVSLGLFVAKKRGGGVDGARGRRKRSDAECEVG